MSRNKREGYFAGKYGSAHILKRGGFKGRRVGRHRCRRDSDKNFSLRG